MILSGKIFLACYVWCATLLVKQEFSNFPESGHIELCYPILASCVSHLVHLAGFGP